MNIVLYEPEIPYNTGNIGRTCLITNTKLHIIEPMAFSLDEKKIKRAGLDYWHKIDLTLWKNFKEFKEKNKDARIFYATTKTNQVYSDIKFQKNDFIVFGPESRGIPEEILEENKDMCITIPMIPSARSLNLSNSVAIILYEAYRQINYNFFEEEKMLSFNNDYSEGAHKRIIDMLEKTNMEQTTGYGTDPYTLEAKKIIKEKFDCKDADIYFISGGTQTNTIAISNILKPYEAVIACKSGHISKHETGAIEATGHKIIEMQGKNFKLTKEDIYEALEEHTDNHMVKPKLVYISNPTELGTLYSLEELKILREVCDKNNLYLYLDGARMASALTSIKNDIQIEDYAKYCDMFYIGGTKCGILFGEALVVVNEKLKDGFDFTIKQRGGLFAKGRLLGVQFLGIFKDNLYLHLGEHSNKMAAKIKDAMLSYGFKEFTTSYTNQLFFIMTKEQIEKLQKKVVCSFEKYGELLVVRFVTSWATKEEDVDELIEFLKTI